MKIFIMSFIIVSSCCYAMESLKLMSYNQPTTFCEWGPFKGALSIQNHPCKFRYGIQMLKDEQPDIVAFQEPWKQDIKKILKKLPYYKQATDADLNYIIYNHEKYEVLEHGMIWLNHEGKPEPDWGSHSIRACVWAKFKILKNEKEFWVFNVHLDHRSEDARIQGAKMAAEKIIELVAPHQIAFLVGDFNAETHSVAVQQLFLEPYWFKNTREMISQNEIKGPHATWIGWDYVSEPQKRIIDYILVNKPDNIDIEAYKTIEFKQDKQASDHRPIMISHFVIR